MSTWTSKTRAAVALAAGLGLAACAASGFGGASRAIIVAGGEVTVTGPSGYCIDRSVSRDGAEGAFVLLGSCAAISGSRTAAQPVRPAVLTASVLPGAPLSAPMAESFEGLAAFFRSAPGRAALSRSGKAETVTVEEVAAAGDVLYLRLSDASASDGRAVEPEYWRAILALKGRIVTLSALGLQDRPLTAAEKRRALEGFVAQMKAVNPVPAATATEPAS
ncbi:hypothetical protein OEZ60_09760 [Defluviimonas sp. WL0024]|uniref:Cation transport ATPase n=2 Tax=Albidovulum TaxID=205889 RepID=A0ABT3IZ51_9RHOB|nr:MULTISPECIES: hypothetical protein [Defluviimonas]MCU9848293.1 hypothetical protein [Defluviimonas sp. WL0024]MCW3780721.1 hypothetical protein [Defluviimonas salinarum]